jgi:hypothetical protein
MAVKLETTSGDRFSELLITKWNLSPLKTSVVAYLVAIVSSFIIALVTGTFQPSGKVEYALVQDYVYWITESIVVPMTWGYYVWIFRAPEKLVTRLELNKAITITDEKIKESNLLYSKALFSWAPVIGGIFFGYLYFVQWVETPTFWYSISPIFLAIRCVIVIGPLGYAVTTLVVRFILNLFVLNNLLGQITLQPLHPDQAGGLQPLGQYAIRSIILWAVGGSIAAGFLVWQLRSSITSDPILIYTASILYCILSPVLFLAPAISTHRSMKDAKYRLLREISIKYDKEQEATLKEIHTDPSSLENHLDKMKQLKQLHSLILEYPEWPYNTKTVRQFFLIISAPIYTVTMDIIITIAKDSLSKFKLP